MTTETKTEDRTVTKALPGGLYCMLGDNTYENGVLKYEGKAGFKYGRSPKDWIRMSYNDLAIFVLWAMENKDFINSMAIAERRRSVAPELK